MLFEGYLNPPNWLKVNNPEMFSSQSGFEKALSKMQVKACRWVLYFILQLVNFFTFFTDKIVTPSV